MTRTCTICNHKDVDEIDKLLVSGESYRSIAKQFEASESAVFRHKESHIPDILLKSNNIQETLNADSLTHQIGVIREKIKSLLQRAIESDNISDAHLFVVDTLKQIELEAKIQGQIQAAQNINVNLQQVNICASAEWIELRTLILNALDDHPQAKEAVILAIRGR